uniref:Glutaredoxin-2, mitochondrial n=3 Tax=Oryctolagus cuniculus TaxID=9986 RepID=G1T510_RABIT
MRPAAARAARGGAGRGRWPGAGLAGGGAGRSRRAAGRRRPGPLCSSRPRALTMSWRRTALAATQLFRSGRGATRHFAGEAGAGMEGSISPSLEKSSAAPVNLIQETISDNCVVIFSKTTCSYCTMAKKLFRDMNVNCKVVELDTLEYGSQFQDALYRMTGERTVPRIFVNGTFIGGATDTHRLHKEGKLLPLVHQCYLKKK